MTDRPDIESLHPGAGVVAEPTPEEAFDKWIRESLAGAHGSTSAWTERADGRIN